MNIERETVQNGSSLSALVFSVNERICFPSERGGGNTTAEHE